MITASVSVTVETSGHCTMVCWLLWLLVTPLTPARKQKQQLSHLISSTHCTQDHTSALILHPRVNLSMVDDFRLKMNIFTLCLDNQ